MRFTCRFFLVFAIGFSLTVSFAAQDGKKLPRDIKWVTSSVEYAALCEQIYRSAWPLMQQKVSAMNKNWVVVLDVDETVLDNSQYAVERVAVDSGFTQQSWDAWVARTAAPPVPGVKSFLEKIRGLGEKAHIAFITNRNSYNESATVANLRKHGIFKDGDTILTQTGKEDTKADRRVCLETGTGRCEQNGPLVILAVFGDNIRDFMPMSGQAKAMQYRDEQLPDDARWGTEYFMLPNPTYGSWERDYE